MAISKKLRFEVFKRDGFQCQYCGRTPPKIILEADHVIPRSKGGEDDIRNLVTSCFDCNRGKGKRDLKVLPDSSKKNIGQIREKEEQLKEYYKLQESIKLRIKSDIDYLDEKWFGLENDKEHCFSDHMRLQIKNLLNTFTKYEIEEAMEIAFSKRIYSLTNRFKYMCGVLWNKLKGN